MKKLIRSFIIAALAILVLPSIVPAQQGMQAQNRFEQALRTTDDVIRRAGEIINQSGLERGRQMLNLAIELQERARNHGSNSQFVIGAKFTLEARDKAKTAISLCRQAVENENLVKNQLEKTDNLINRIGSHFTAGENNSAQSLFNAAKENQRRAWELYYNRQLRPALKLSRQAEKSLLRIAEMVKNRAGRNNRIQNQILQTESQAEQIRSMIRDCRSEEAERLMAEADKSLEECYQYVANGQYKQARNAIRSTRRLIRSAADICGGSGSQWQNLNRLSNEIEQVGQAILDRGKDKAREFYDSAIEYMEKAENHCAKGDTEACAANIKAAQMNLEKAKRLIGI